MSISAPTPRLLVIGSCVSRDILNFLDRDKVVLADYYARSSLAALTTQPAGLCPSQLENIASPFQRRTVERETTKDLYRNGIASIAADAILIDLIDERFDVYEAAPDVLITASVELYQSGFFADKDRDCTQWIRTGSERHRSLWQRGVERFFEKLKAHGLEQRVIVNKVFWTDQLEDGTPLPNDDRQKRLLANEHLKWMYGELERYVPVERWLVADAQHLRASSNHRWGVAAFHYVDAYYHEMAAKLVEMIAAIRQGVALNVMCDERSIKVRATTCMTARRLFAFGISRGGAILHTQPYSAQPWMHIDTIFEVKDFSVWVHILDLPERAAGAPVPARITHVISYSPDQNFKTSMKIRQLTITKRPIWFEVPEQKLEHIEISATSKYWPSSVRGAALLLFDFAEPVAPEILAAYGIAQSALGNYVYLKQDQPDPGLKMAISLPPLKLRRIGLRLWNSPAPILLVQLAIQTQGGAVDSPYAESSREAGATRLAGSRDWLGLNLLNYRDQCGASCHAICQHWYETMDDVQRRHPKIEAGRTNFSLPIEDAAVPVTLYHAQPAMLRIPGSVSAYLQSIGDKSRNMIRKAERGGYVYREVDPNNYLDDVLAIRTSDPERQGKAIPEYFKNRPESVYDKPLDSQCTYHGEDFYGIFKGDTLVAYATIFFYGELAQVNHILGHKEHLSEGVMNLLVRSLVGSIIEQRPWVKAINYLYRGNDMQNGLAMFKKSTGFQPENLVVTQEECGLHEYFEMSSLAEVKPEPAVRSIRKSVKAASSRELKAAANIPSILHDQPAENGVAARMIALEKISQMAPSVVVPFQGVHAVVMPEHFATGDSHVVVFENIVFDEYKDFLSSKLKSLRTVVPLGSFVMFDLKRTLDLRYVPGKGGFQRFLPSVLHPRGPAINEQLLRYFEQRFKSTCLTLDDLRTGFKGSDYAVAGLIEYRADPSPRSFDSLLILRKIR